MPDTQPQDSGWLDEILDQIPIKGRMTEHGYKKAKQAILTHIKKQVLLGKIETIQIIDSHLRLEGIPLRLTQAESLKTYMRELEQQLEAEGENAR